MRATRLALRRQAAAARATRKPPLAPAAGLAARRRRAARARACRRGRGRRRRSRCAAARRGRGRRSRARARRRASARAPRSARAPACLSAFVSASWTIRYAARSMPGRQRAALAARPCSSTGRPGGAGALDQRVELGQRRLRRERAARRPRRVQQAEQPAHLGQRLAPGVLDLRGGRRRRGRGRGRGSAARRRPGRPSPRRVRDDVVHLARDPAALLGHRPGASRSWASSARDRGLVQLLGQLARGARSARGRQSQAISTNTVGKSKSLVDRRASARLTPRSPTSITGSASQRPAPRQVRAGACRRADAATKNGVATSSAASRTDP